MELETINPYVMKILIAARDEDSINSISKRIKLSFGWTYKWINELTKIGVFKATRMKLFLNKENEFYKKTIKYIRDNFSNDISFNYSVLSLFGIKYCFTKTDAVFVWTKGGYNIARYREFYPIFIKIKKEDYPFFKEYSKRIGLKEGAKKGIFYNVEIVDDFEVSYCEDIPVDSLKETALFMQKNIYNFEPALEMIKEMYHLKIKVKYKEVFSNV